MLGTTIAGLIGDATEVHVDSASHECLDLVKIGWKLANKDMTNAKETKVRNFQLGFLIFREIRSGCTRLKGNMGNI